MEPVDRKEIVRKEYEQFMAELEKASTRSFHLANAHLEKLRSECPFCGSKELTYDFKNVNGKIKGETRGSFGVFGGSIYGWVDGSIDTDKVFYCQKCKNAWKDEELKYKSRWELLGDLLWPLYKWFKEKDTQVEFDPNDPTEKFESWEDKQADHLAYLKKRFFDPPSYLRSLHADTIRWIINKNCFYLEYRTLYEDMEYWPDSKYEEWGCKTFPQSPATNWFTRLFS